MVDASVSNFISAPSDWTPLKHYTNVFEEYAPVSLGPSDPWQFENFLVQDRDGGTGRWQQKHC